MVTSDWNAIYMIPSWTRPHEAALAGRIPNKLTAPALRQPMPTLATMKSAANISRTKKIRATISQMNQEPIFTFQVPVLMVMIRFLRASTCDYKGPGALPSRQAKAKQPRGIPASHLRRICNRTAARGGDGFRNLNNVGGLISLSAIRHGS